MHRCQRCGRGGIPEGRWNCAVILYRARESLRDSLAATTKISQRIRWHQRRSAAAGSVGGKRSEGAGAASTAAPGVQGGCQGAPISPRCTLLSRPAARACGRGLQQRVVGAAGRLLKSATTGRCACAAGHGRCSRRRHRWGYIPVSLSWRTGSRAFARREREEPCAKHAQRRRNRRRRINACGQARNSQQHQSN